MAVTEAQKLNGRIERHAMKKCEDINTPEKNRELKRLINKIICFIYLL